MKVKEWEENIRKRKILDKKKRNKELIELQKSFEEKQKEKEEKEKEFEKRKKLRIKLDLQMKIKEQKKALKLKLLKEEELKKKINLIKERENQRLKNEELKKMEEEMRIKEEEEKINKMIENLKLNAKKEKEIELKESKLDNDISKHEFRLSLLKEYVDQYLKHYKSNNISMIFELINKIGKIYKKEIEYDKKYYKDNFIYLSDAIQSDDMIYNFLGVLGEEFKKYNVYSIIEKKSNDTNLIDGIFKVLLSAYSILPKYEIKIRSESFMSECLSDPKKWIDFIDNLKCKISEKFTIDITKIYFISHRIDLCELTMVILDKEPLDFKKYESNLNIIARKDALLEYIKLSPQFFDNKYNKNINSWNENNNKRGGEKYFPPIGGKGFALKVLNKFDNGDNSWLGNEGKEGEWAVGYHGIGKGNEFKKLMNIILNNLKNGPCQLYKSAPNIRDKNKGLSGVGVYLTADIKEAEKYAAKIKLGQRTKNFQFIIMCRVKPESIRVPFGYRLNWIVDGNYDCLRPYRILVKES